VQRHDWNQWAGFWRRPYRSPGQLRDYQGRKLAQLVRFAGRQVPFYQRRFEEHGLDPSQIRSLADIGRTPLTQKPDLQQASLAERVARGSTLSRCVDRRSSGSTGRPMRILRSRAEENLLFAHRLRTLLHLGLRFRDRRLGVGVRDITPLWPHRLGILPVSGLDPYLAPSEVLQEVRRLRPNVLRVRADLLRKLVQRPAVDELRELGVRLVFCGGALTSKSLRLQAQEAFGCPVIDLYGAHEMNLVAFECPDCNSCHAIDDSVVLEVLNEDGQEVGPGEDGAVFVTALHSFTMPFIRYSLGDIASRPTETVTCRFGFTRLATIKGRQQQVLEFPCGVLVYPSQICAVLQSVPGIGRFQVVREGLRQVSVHAEPVPGQRFSLDEIRSRCAEIFPEDVFVKVEEKAIQTQPGLKHCYVRTSPSFEAGG
jgi:phenylacetate-CoA ligase